MVIVNNDARHWEYLIANLAAYEGLFSCVNNLYVIHNGTPAPKLRIRGLICKNYFTTEFRGGL